jgi:hypothetical protein
LIAEIKRVMADPKLRQQEADEAKKNQEARYQKKYVSIDRHIRLVLSKVRINKKELANLAKVHNVRPEMILRRLKAKGGLKYAAIDRQIEKLMQSKTIGDKDIAKLAKANEIETELIRKRVKSILHLKFNAIDNYLKIRTTKDYITQEEIAGLAELHDIGEDQILRRINCPVRKKVKSEEDVQALDDTIENVINQNLVIVGSPSLYDFLGLWMGSSLEALQKSAQEKETEIRRAAHKDAVITASGIIVGHCISIFKDAKSRNAYDLSRARARLTELNQDIDIAGLDGMVKADYLDFLTKRAVEFGVDPDEAREYIRNYCHKHDWKVETPPKKRKPLPKKRIAIAAGVVLMIGGLVAFYFIYSQTKATAYQKTVAQALKHRNLEKRMSIWQAYIKTGPSGPYAEKATETVNRLKESIEARDFKASVEEAQKHIKNNDFNKAAASYDKFISKHRNGMHSADAQRLRSNIPALEEDYDFKQLQAIDVNDVDGRADAYLGYLAKHGSGKNRTKVNDMLIELHEPFYQHTQKALKRCRQAEDWPKCLQLCNRFLTIYPDQYRSIEVHRELKKYQQFNQDTVEWEAILAQAETLGDDYQQIKALYIDFLEDNPNTSVKPKIQKEIESLHLTLKRELLAKTKGNYSEIRPGVIKDKQTGLMWSMNDSMSDKGQCIDYKGAINYVRQMRAGGYKDWRLPTVKELAKIYHQKPKFPFKEGEWYWTANNYKRYQQGWYRIVDIVPADGKMPETVPQMDESECGTARAVRP